MNTLPVIGAVPGHVAGHVAGLVVPLADKVPDPSQVGQGWLGFVVFIALALAVVLLWLSFRKQLKKIDFEEKPTPRRRTRNP